MVKSLVTIDADKPVIDAARLMKKHKIGSVIVTKDERIVGILTERDMVDRVVSSGLNVKKMKVGSVMSYPIITCSMNASVSEAIQIMENYKVRHLPVVDKKGNIVGIISSKDVV